MIAFPFLGLVILICIRCLFSWKPVGLNTSAKPRIVRRIFSKIELESPSRSSLLAFADPQPIVVPLTKSHIHTEYPTPHHVAPISRDFSTRPLLSSRTQA